MTSSVAGANCTTLASNTTYEENLIVDKNFDITFNLTFVDGTWRVVWHTLNVKPCAVVADSERFEVL